MKELGLIVKTVDLVITLKIQSMLKVEVMKTEDSKTVTMICYPNAKEIWDFLGT
jgi:hypothetical protein